MEPATTCSTSFAHSIIAARRNFEDGLAAMAAVSDELETARRAQLLGQLNDGAGNYDEAWLAFSRMNEFQRATRHAQRSAPPFIGRQSGETLKRRRLNGREDWTDVESATAA